MSEKEPDLSYDDGNISLNQLEAEEAGLLPSADRKGHVRPPIRPIPARKRYNIPNAVLLIGTACLFGFGYLIAYVAVGFTRYGHQTKVNVILCISDGFGPASETFARAYIRYLKQSGSPQVQSGGRWAFQSVLPPPHLDDDELDEDATPNYFVRLPLDTIQIGQSRTRSSNSLVTDSAAGATAFACGIKSYNGAIAVDPETRQPCATVLEAAKHKGYLTGLVATSRITHATPAAFYAHVTDRDEESRIAEMLVGDFPLGVQVDYALGGGRCFFLPNTTTGSCRTDDRDLVKIAQDNAFNVVQDPSSFARMPSDASGLGTIGLFGLDHLNYEADRVLMLPETREPSLKEMSQKALGVLSDAASSRSAHGFFLMIEGSRIDMAGHSNDPVGHLYDILAYQETIAEVKTFVDAQNKAGWPTVMISVSDHETGGMALGRQLDPGQYPDYLWLPDAIENATHSTFWTGQQIAGSNGSRDVIGEMTLAMLGLNDLSEEEFRLLEANAKNSYALDRYLADMLSKRAQIGWSTSGHSGVDVNLYAYGYQANQLRGNRENTEIGSFIERIMDLQLSHTTREMLLDSNQWHSTELKASNDSLTHVAHYHHDWLKYTGPAAAQQSGAPANHLYLPSNDPT